MTLDLSNWSDRQTYFLGRFYDLPTQLLLTVALRPGETFVDVGGNVGMLTLMAARCVGPQGVVHSFEPNPVAFARLREHVQVNKLNQVRLHHAGLADEPAELTLSVVGPHSGTGTLAPLAKAHDVTDVTTYPIRVLRGDDVLADLPLRPLVVKVDVEGFECRVLKGLSRVLRERASQTLVVTEAVNAHLSRAGASKAEMLSIMHACGYRAFALATRREYLRHRLELTPLGGPADWRTNNVVWLRLGGEHERRLRQSIAC